jgi:NAD(P)-dependent dehydrogenase (short-subunit alcohol dehydrogenase family)
VCRQCRQLVNLEEILMDVGFIGLGRMGQAMARNLLKAGFRVIVFNRTRRRAEELRDEGAEVADSPGAPARAKSSSPCSPTMTRWRKSSSAAGASSVHREKTPFTSR